MAGDSGAITFLELLAANEEETGHWREWFQKQPASLLDIPTQIAHSTTLRDLLLHIVAVELRYAERLRDMPVTPYEKLPTSSATALFGVAERAHVLFRQFLAQAQPEDFAKVQEFPTRTAGVLTASKRKMFIHALLHSIRHWAQMAVLLREHGYPTDWQHDFLFSKAMQ